VSQEDAFRNSECGSFEAVHFREELRDFFGRMLQVVVDRDDSRAPSRPNPGQHRIVLTVVAHEIERMNRAVVASEFPYDVPGAVRASVVDEQDLQAAAR